MICQCLEHQLFAPSEIIDGFENVTQKFQTMLSLFHLPQFIKLWQIFLELNSNGLFKSSGKEKENCCLVFTFPIKRKTTKSHDVVVQLRHKNRQKSVMHVQSC